MKPRKIVFLFNLVQDVNIIRPVALLAQELDVDIIFLRSQKFAARDKQNIWLQALQELAASCGAAVADYDSPFSAYRLVQGGAGAMIAASESNVAAHAETHDVFRSTPSGYTKITLQHGFECIGFLQNREHYAAHGRGVRFAADILACWMPAERLTSMAYSERDKVFLTGPGLLLQQPKSAPIAPAQGMVCENLHSVRLSANGDVRPAFMADFGYFCSILAQRGETVCLRPHPGGQFLNRNEIPLPPNALADDRPIYDVDLSRFAYGISAPSSVVLDMVLAGLPTALWADPDDLMDINNYEGMTVIRRREDWLAFHRDVRLRPETILSRQRQFIEQTEMPLDPAVIKRNFRNLLELAVYRAEAQTVPYRTGAAM